MRKRAPSKAREKSAASGLDGLDAPDDRPEVVALLSAIKAALPRLKKLLKECSDHWGYEDAIYRFYHQSFKVHWAQDSTKIIVEALKALSPRPINEWFAKIVAEGTTHDFDL